MSIMPLSVDFRRPVKNPACPSIVFSIRALHGQTVTQWPQETQLDSPMVEPPSQSTRGFGSSQLIESVSFTSTFWQASTQRPQRTHWSGVKRKNGFVSSTSYGLGRKGISWCPTASSLVVL